MVVENVLRKLLKVLFFITAWHLIFSSQTLIAKDRGQSWYKLCAFCHGDMGEGKQEIGAPPIAGLPQWYIEGQLKKFKGGVRGYHPDDAAGLRMSPMGRMLKKDEDLAAVAAHVAKMPRPKLAKDDVGGSWVKGEAQYQVCQACHGPKAQGMQALGAPPLVGMPGWYMLKQLKDFKAKVRGSNPAIDPMGATMSPIAMTLSDEAMVDVVAYIQGL